MRNTAWMGLGIGIAVLGAVCCFGTFLERDMSTGESYPRCSSLRVDPLGSKALYDALSKMPGLACERNFLPLSKLQGRRDATLLLLNVLPEDLSHAGRINGDDVLGWVAQGGRAIVTLSTYNDAAKRHHEGEDDDAALTNREFDHLADLDKQPPKKPGQEQATKSLAPPGSDRATQKASKSIGSQPAKDQGAADKKAGSDAQDEDKSTPSSPKTPRSMDDAFGFSIGGRAFVLTPKGGEELKWASSFPTPRQDRPKWYTRTYLKTTLDDDAENPWHVLAWEDKDAVLMERHLGRGSVVVASDSFFATNEALFREPHPTFITWLLGGANWVVFDETHLGVREHTGVMSLAFRHHLHGLFLGALVLFILLLWQGHSTLVPRLDPGDRERRNLTSGFGATAGFVSLLRRGLPRSRLLRQCLDQWERGRKGQSPTAQARLQKARAIVDEEEAKPGRQRRPHEAYTKICAVLHSKH